MGLLRINPLDKGRRPLWPDLNSRGPKGEPPPITAKEFAESFHFELSNVYDLIVKGRVYGVWVRWRGRKRWYVYPHTYRAPGELLPRQRYC
jgi:hypothetical protein